MNISEEWYVFTHTPLVLYLHVSRMLFTMAAGIQIKWKSTLRQCKKKEREMNVRALTTRRRRLVTMLWSIQWKRGLNWGKKRKENFSTMFHWINIGFFFITIYSFVFRKHRSIRLCESVFDVHLICCSPMPNASILTFLRYEKCVQVKNVS